VLTGVQPVLQPRRPGHQRDRASAQDRHGQGAESGRQESCRGALPDPAVHELVRTVRFQSAVKPPGHTARRQRPAEQQDPGQRHDRIDSRPRQPRLGSVLAESERHHGVHDQAEREARPGADGQRGRGYPRPPRRHGEDARHVHGDNEQEKVLGEPGELTGRPGCGSARDPQNPRVGRRQRQDRRVPADAEQPAEPAATGLPEEPARQPRKPGQQQDDRDHIDPGGHGGEAARRTRPGGQRHIRRRHREQQRACDPSRHQRLPGYHPHRTCPPGQPREPGRHLVCLGPDRLGPVTPPAQRQPRRPASSRCHGPA
jgi:hypothetical protein